MIPFILLSYLQTRINRCNLFHWLLTLLLFVLPIAKTISQETEGELQKKLTHHMSPEEEKLKHLIGKDFVSTPPPTGLVRNVAEFEQMQGVLIRYP
ncbi:MAG: hypothetical protein K8R86_10500, partial [Bacteroidales bacterium]|nr:hypothetical protein [Bacteroidales bacterium]